MTETGGGIACIGWGSLVWDTGDLPVKGPWHYDGPMLPVEFLRESGAKKTERGNQITLVIHPDAPRVRTCWIMLDAHELEAARRALASRERIPNRWDKDIGYADCKSEEREGAEADAILAWARGRNLDAVVWTNLPCKFDGKQVASTIEQVIDFLRPLEGTKAEEYVRKAPEQIDTPYRRRIVDELGWSYEAEWSPAQGPALPEVSTPAAGGWSSPSDPPR